MLPQRENQIAHQPRGKVVIWLVFVSQFVGQVFLDCGQRFADHGDVLILQIGHRCNDSINQ